MRAVVAGMVAWCALSASGEAAAGTEWVVLRVERVEVAVARTDGSPWDDGPVEREWCGLFIGSSLDKTARKQAKDLCIAPTGTDAGDPDLFVRLVAGGAGDYVTAVAPNATTHQFAADFLIPLEVVEPGGIALEVGDQEGHHLASAELLGSVKLTLADVRHLLAHPSRIKTLSGGSVTRLEVTAKRHRSSRSRIVRLDNQRATALTPLELAAGELLEVRARGGMDAVAVIGGRLSEVSVGRCVRALVPSSGRLLLAIDQGVDVGTRVLAVSRKRPSIRLWRQAVPRMECLAGGQPVSAAKVSRVDVPRHVVTPTADAVRTVLERRYLQGSRRCHERGLRRDPAAYGSVRMIFRLLETGAASFINVGGFDSTIDICIQSLIGKWRFAAPKDASGKPTIADVDVDLSL